MCRSTYDLIDYHSLTPDRSIFSIPIPIPIPYQNTGHITSLSVLRTHRKRGIGTLLLKKLY